MNRDEERTWALMSALMTWLPAAIDARLAESSRLSHIEYQTLRWLSLTEARSLHMTTLADSTNVTPSHLSRIVSRLEREGWLTRAPDPADKRCILATLSRKGARVVAATDAAYEQAVRDLVLRRLDRSEIGTLGDACEKLLEHLKPECVQIVHEAFGPGRSRTATRKTRHATQ